MSDDFYAVIEPDGSLRQLRSDWVSRVVDANGALVGYLYHPEGDRSNQSAVPLRTSEVARVGLPSKDVAPVR